MDYTNETNTTYVELKTRRIRHDAYHTALIGANKIAFCSDPLKTYFFVFCYLDGIYYIKYDAAVFATFERSDNYYRGARPDCSNSVQSVVYIPINRLKAF